MSTDRVLVSIGLVSSLKITVLILLYRAVFQLIRFLPVNTKSLPHELSSPQIHIRPQTGACTFPTLDTRPHALESSLAGGCDGLRMAVWMHDNELQIGNAVAGPDSGVLLGRFGFDPLLVKLDDVAESPSNDNEPTSSQPDSSRTFLLMLDAKTSLHELYPLLVEQLDTLRQRGYLSHWDGGNVVQRSVTVVVTGESSPNSDCVNHSYSDIFWSAVPEGRVTTSDFTKDGLQYLSPFCIV
jgi:hypothetical protein